ncbi:hypothetical protein C3L33_23373, partial [Rhododendron williamsianum]
MTEQIIEKYALKGRAPTAFILYNSNEVVAKLKDARTIITNQTKRDIGDQWKSLSNEERQKYKDVAEAAKEELAKYKDLFPAEPKKVKINACSAVQSIGLGGILQLRCTFLNHALCKWLVGKFDPVSRSLTVHGRTFVVTESHVMECLGINGQGNVIDLEGNTSDSCAEVCKNVGLTNGVVQLKHLREYLEKTEEVDDVFKRKFALYILGCFLCPNTKAGVTRSLMNVVSYVGEMGNQNWAKLTLQFLCKGIRDQRDKGHVQPSGCLFLLVVFYFERVSPTVKPFIRKFPYLVVWGDDEIKRVLHQFDKIGGYDSDGVVVHFTQVGEPTGNEGGVSQISTADVQTMTSTFVTVAGLLLRQNMFMAKLLGSEIQSNLREKMGQQMDVNHVQLFGQASALFKGLQSCQSSPPTAFETYDVAMNESKGLSTKPSRGSHIGFEMPSWSQLEAEMAHEIDLEPVHPSERSSPQVTSPNISETATPNKFKTPEPEVQKSKGPDTRTTGKRRIQVDMDADVCSPSPVKEFRSLGGLSRGRKRKLSIGNPILHVGGYDNVEVHYEAPRLRHPDHLKKSHFQRSPFTKDSVKKRNPPKKLPVNENLDNVDVNVPSFRGRYSSKKALQFVGVQALNPQTMPYIEDMADDARKPTYEPLTDHEKLFTEFIFDIRDPSNGLKPRIWILDTRHIFDNPNMTDCDVKKLCDSYFRDANFTDDIWSCSMIYIPTNDHGSDWFCIKLDIGIRMAYIFYSKPASRSNIARKKLTRTVLEGLHRALVFQYGDLYQVDVTKFNIANVQRQPLQHDTDGYDCGLFVIKFMQGFNYPSSVHRMDDIERPRLLTDLCGDENNWDALEVLKKFEAWKAEKGQYMPITGRMSYFELRDVINETGCSNLVRVFYQVTATNGEIRLVLIDGDVGLAEMFDLYGRGAQIHIYLDDPLWSDESDNDSQRELLPNLSAIRTTGKGRRMGGQSTTARRRGRGSGRVGPTGIGGARGDAFARGAATGKGQ